MKKALLISFALILLGCCSADAYDLVVTVLSGNISRKKVIDKDLFAFNPENSTAISQGKVNKADSTYIFKSLPNELLWIIYEMDGNTYGKIVDEPTDSIVMHINEHEEEEATNLNEVVVEGDNSYLTDEKEVYLPTSRDKKISYDGTSLLQNMAISSIYVSPLDKSITTASGEEVSTFIDYLPATQTDLANIKTSNVQKVEVFDYPKDPRFHGAKHVVNYVMVKYEYGGYTRFDVAQCIIKNQGNYNGYSTLTTHRMTYDVGITYNYLNSKKNYTSTNSEYKFPSGTVLSDKNAIGAIRKDRTLSAFARALYRSKNTVVSNIVGVSTLKKPNNYSASNEIFNTDNYISSKSESFTDSKNTTVSWEGNFQFFLPNNFTWITKTNASYGKFKSDYEYIAESSSVINNTDEDAWSADVSTSLSKRLSGNTLTVALSAGAEGNDMEYIGTSPSTVDAKYYHGGVRVNGSFKINRVNIDPTVHFYVDRNTFDGMGYTRYNPKYYISASYLLNSKNKFNLSSEMYYMSPAISQMGSNVQIQDQVEAITGNPNLKTEIVNNIYVNYNYFPIRHLSFTAYGAFKRNSRLLTSHYEPAEINGQTYMLRGLANRGFKNGYQYGLSASSRLLNNALSLRIGVEGNSTIQHSEASCDFTRFNYYAVASYSFSNMYVAALYQSSNKTMANWGISERPQYYYFTYGYAYKNFNFRVIAINLFNSAYKGNTYRMLSENRVSTQRVHTNDYHRSFEIGVSYSFSYGKKLGNIENVSAPSGVQSGSLR